jgi:hypothetical protein
VCHLCGGTVVGACQHCTEAWHSRRPAAELTPAERLAEFDRWMGPLEIDFPLVHERIEELVGRPVLTHELGLCVPELRAEILAEVRGVPELLPASAWLAPRALTAEDLQRARRTFAAAPRPGPIVILDRGVQVQVRGADGSWQDLPELTQEEADALLGVTREEVDGE